jgi:hypothetical protein
VAPNATGRLGQQYLTVRRFGVEAGAGSGSGSEPSRARAGGEQHTVCWQGLGVVEQDRAAGRVDGSCPKAQPQLDLVGAELVLGNDRAERGLHVVDVDQLLRQRRPLLGRMPFRADDHDLAGEPDPARGHRSADASRARTDDDVSYGPHRVQA